MNILIANDDGVFAPGIQALAEALRGLGRVVVVAPEADRSGSSSALTVDRPLRPVQISTDVWAVNGTPADCVYLAMNGLFDFSFDLVVSGINNGPNLGDHVLYSGTVGAAMGGRLNTLPSLAISLCGAQVRSYTSAHSFQVAAEWVRDFIAAGLPELPPRHILNINIPDIAAIQGVKVTHQSHCAVQKQIISQIDPRGREVFWIALSKDGVAETPLDFPEIEADFIALQQGFVSISPLKMDATDYDVAQNLNRQFSKCAN